MNSKKPGILFDNRYFDHFVSRPSLENARRLRHLYRQLETADYRSRFMHFSPREASIEDIQDVHSSFYVDQIREHALNADPFSYDRDTYLMELSLYTAQLAAGGCLELADRILSGEIDYGFALIRPPGHHAEPGRGMGFCIFNNIAITARYLRRRYDLQRILIFDFDIHHCNGTQAV
ncbi:MAG TPA: histone deacetylase, partial [Desulfobulbus sp.]|nr:histone deacetylase [Desulfobulbus sp.]